MTTAKDQLDRLVDPARLSEIEALDAMRSDPILDQLVAEATERLNLPIGVVSIVLDSAQYFVASKGLEGWLAEAQGSPVEWSFCQHVVCSQDDLVIDDAESHPQVRDSPLTQEGVRSYAGVPLETSQGEVLGSFCVIGDTPRHFSEGDLDQLRNLAHRAMKHLEQRRASRDGSPETR